MINPEHEFIVYDRAKDRTHTDQGLIPGPPMTFTTPLPVERPASRREHFVVRVLVYALRRGVDSRQLQDVMDRCYRHRSQAWRLDMMSRASRYIMCQDKGLIP